MFDFSKYKFKQGKALTDANVYLFIDDKKNKLYVSQLKGKFQSGETSRYLKFDFMMDDESISFFVDRQSKEYKEYNNICPIIENYNGIVTQCKGCNTIVLSTDIKGSNNDKCIYCDIYICKKCRKMHPLVELDENRLCAKCRNEVKNAEL